MGNKAVSITKKQVNIRTAILFIPSLIFSYYFFDYANMYQIIGEPFGLFIAVGLVIIFAFATSKILAVLSMVKLR